MKKFICPHCNKEVKDLRKGIGCVTKQSKNKNDVSGIVPRKDGLYHRRCWGIEAPDSIIQLI